MGVSCQDGHCSQWIDIISATSSLLLTAPLPTVLFHCQFRSSFLPIPALLLWICCLHSFSEVLEHVCDLGSILGRYGEVYCLVLFGKAIHILFLDASTAFQIGLIACDGKDDLLWGVLLQFCYPFLDLHKGFGRSDVIDYDCSCCILVINGCERVVLLLPGGVLHEARSTQMAILACWPDSSFIFFSR